MRALAWICLVWKSVAEQQWVGGLLFFFFSSLYLFLCLRATGVQVQHDVSTLPPAEVVDTAE